MEHWAARQSILRLDKLAKLCRESIEMREILFRHNEWLALDSAWLGFVSLLRIGHPILTETVVK